MSYEDINKLIKEQLNDCQKEWISDFPTQDMNPFIDDLINRNHGNRQKHFKLEDTDIDRFEQKLYVNFKLSKEDETKIKERLQEKIKEKNILPQRGGSGAFGALNSDSDSEDDTEEDPGTAGTAVNTDENYYPPPLNKEHLPNLRIISFNYGGQNKQNETVNDLNIYTKKTIICVQEAVANSEGVEVIPPEKKISNPFLKRVSKSDLKKNEDGIYEKIIQDKDTTYQLKMDTLEKFQEVKEGNTIPKHGNMVLATNDIMKQFSIPSCISETYNRCSEWVFLNIDGVGLICAVLSLHMQIPDKSKYQLSTYLEIITKLKAEAEFLKSKNFVVIIGADMQNIGWCEQTATTEAKKNPKCSNTSRTVELDTIFEDVLFSVQSNKKEGQGHFPRNIDYIYCSEKEFVNIDPNEIAPNVIPVDKNHKSNDVIYTGWNYPNSEDTLSIKLFKKNTEYESCKVPYGIVVLPNETNRQSLIPHAFTKISLNVNFIVESPDTEFTDEINLNGIIFKLSHTHKYIRFENGKEYFVRRYIHQAIMSAKEYKKRFQLEYKKKGEGEITHEKLEYNEILNKLKTQPIVRIPLMKL